MKEKKEDKFYFIKKKDRDLHNLYSWMHAYKKKYKHFKIQEPSPILTAFKFYANF